MFNKNILNLNLNLNLSDVLKGGSIIHDPDKTKTLIVANEM